MYTTNQKASIENVLLVFKDYLDSSKDIAIAWSDKLGYLFIGICALRDGVDLDTNQITDGMDLCRRCLHEIMVDIVLEAHTEHYGKTMNSLERAEFQKRTSSFMAQLPEYTQAIDDILNE